ncbi:DUF3219 family protein [Oceanobacillus sp. FSL H7-0719]|uniref:DUF3219 family protein n=1 Tax=Oceanobacillus sp. FSL H7-0719 TaxID=2954507 RepID=UPI003246BD96
MSIEIQIDHVILSATNFSQHAVLRDEEELRRISFDFNVDSDAYHEITTLLYKNDFLVKVPEKELEFPAVIHNYSTSITNLYVEGNVGEFSLELIEKNKKPIV